jgi:16S rRNA (guanine527-N7)-methyltransferase
MSGSEILPIWPGQLQQGVSRMGLKLEHGEQQRLLDYLALLARWNRTFNLTAIRDPDEMVSRQLLDSLSILPLIQGPSVLDVGTGAGLPGIPLAITRPDFHFVLLDSNGKKTRFVRQAKMELGLENVTVVQERVESWRPQERFDTVTARAFAALPKMIDLTAGLLRESGLLLAMKGLLPWDEIEQIRAKGMVVESVALEVPGVSGEHHAILCSRVEP